MSRKLWQQRLLESVFYFFTDELKHALLGQLSEQLRTSGEVIWPDIAENLRPFFVVPDAGGEFIGNVLLEVYKERAFSEKYFDKTLQSLLADQSPNDAIFMRQLAKIPSTDEEIAIYLKMAREFEVLLDAMEDDEIVAAYRQLEIELASVNKFRRDRDGSARDKFAFFNEMPSDARFDYWLQVAAWNAEECIALSLGKEPTRVNPVTLQLKVRPRFHSPFRERFKSRLEILRRAQLHGSFQELIAPRDFVAWALKLKWDLPSEIHVAAEKKAKTEFSSHGDALGTSLNTICRLLLGMAITRFEHRTTQNSSATAMIELELEDLKQIDAAGPNTLGKITVKQDTIRTVLNAAATHLDASWSNIIQWKGVKRPKSGT